MVDNSLCQLLKDPVSTGLLPSYPAAESQFLRLADLGWHQSEAQDELQAWHPGEMMQQ